MIWTLPAATVEDWPAAPADVIMKKQLFISLLMLVATAATMSAYNFEVDGFYFEYNGNRTVAVTCGGSYEDPESYLGTYSGWYLPVIPATVTYRNVTYTVTAIADNAFAWSEHMEYVEIPNTVESIGFQSFNGCHGLERAVIPSSVKRIASAAYSFCYDLTEVKFGNSLEKIGQCAFGWCSSLSTVVCEAPVPPVLDDDDSSVMYGDCFSSYTIATLYVPYESLDAYRESEIWGRFSTILPIGGVGGLGDVNGDGNVSIGDVAFLIDRLIDGNGNPAYNDVNGDGAVSIADVTALIDQLLGAN